MSNEIHYGNASPAQRRFILRMIAQDLAKCQSALVDALLANESVDGFSYDDICNAYERVCPECGSPMREAVRDMCIWCEKEWDKCACGDGKDTGNRNDEADVWVCEGCGHIQFDDPEYEVQEIYEWWLLSSSSVAEDLKELGEPVLDNDYGEWWGRTCTGQSVELDPTFWRMYQDVLRDKARMDEE